jgi:hypothetical protein
MAIEKRSVGQRIGTATVILLLATLWGCGSTGVTTFLHGEFSFGFIERVAIIPLENISSDRGAGARATHVLLAEVLAAEAFDVVEPGEVTRVLGQYSTVRTSELTTEQITNIGRELNVQGLFLGAITESSNTRSGGSAVTKVSVALRLIETERGVTVWSSTGTSGSRGFWSSLFGTGGKSISEVTRHCVRKVLGTLLE